MREQQFSITGRRIRPFYWLIAMLLLVVAAGLAQAADTRFVKPRSEAVIRTGQGNQYKIVEVVKEGTAVELLEEGESYALVRLGNGEEGWILRRFLSVEPPLDVQVESLNKEKTDFQEKNEAMTRQVEALTSQLTESKNDQDMLVAERDRLAADYQQLKKDTADVMKIRNDMLQTAEENRQLVDKLVKLEAENTKLAKDKTINWFLAGSGVLVLGVLLGRMPGPSRKRKPSLLS